MAIPYLPYCSETVIYGDFMLVVFRKIILVRSKFWSEAVIRGLWKICARWIHVFVRELVATGTTLIFLVPIIMNYLACGTFHAECRIRSSTRVQQTGPIKGWNWSPYTETKMSSFWWKFHHWLHRKLSFWQLSVQPVMKISSKWRHFRFSV